MMRKITHPMKRFYLTIGTVLFVSYGVVFAQSVTFNYTGSIQTFTVPNCVTSITIDARGAQGGSALGGQGAKMVGTFTVTSAEQLNILVGGQGGPSIGQGAGGGGGSFVADISNNALIVAGGGGGQGSSGAGEPGNITVTGSNGTQPISGGIGGTNGGGGGGASDNGSCISGGGGGGFCGNGGEASNNGTPGAGGIGCNNGANGSSGSLCATGIGISYLNGGAGGVGCTTGGCNPVSGGYGGGGGTAGGGGAGGGGYSGGGGGGWNSGTPSGGGGGGSYNNGSNQNNTTGFQSGNGQVTISWVPSSGVTVSSSASTGASCNGDSNGTATINPTGGSSPYTYLWNPSSQTNITATGLSAGTYTVTITDAGGCTASTSIIVTQPNAINTIISSIPADSACTGEHVILNASGANSYLWSTSGTSSSITVVIPAGDTAYYWVKGIVGGCNDSVPLKIKVIPVITATIVAFSDTVCPHGSTIIIATGIGGQATYKWSNGYTTSSITVTDTVTTTYTATVYGICDSTKIMKTVTVIPLPKPLINGSLWKCKGTKDTLSVSSSINPTTYKWSNGETGSSIITGAINGDSTIYVTAENSLGCSVKDSFKITERSFPTGSVTYIPNCGTLQDTITAKAGGLGPFTYQWSTGGTHDTVVVTVPDTTTFSVVISNGCPITKTITVDPYFPSLSACCNNTILIGHDTTISAIGTGIKTYQWLPGAGLNCDTCANVIATPTVTTTYTVIGIDAAGCRSERTITIVVETPCFNFTVPNVFTPTNPGTLGVDNKFYINTGYSNLSSWSILIDDRWGKEIFKSTNPNEYWDGNTEGGGAAPAGVYYYIIDGVCQGTTYKKDGYVQLIR